MFGKSLYRQQSHHLNKMGVKELNRAFFTHYTVQVYAIMFAALIAGSIYLGISMAEAGFAGFVTLALFPVFWYITHRYIMHGSFMWKSPITAGLFKRIHYDHHQDPHHLEVLFGALYTTLPSTALTTMPFGYAIAGLPGAMFAYAIGLFMTTVYEYVHCIQHLNFKPKNRFLMELKKHHMMHHFHDEDGNFGITNFTVDKILGTFYERSERKVRSTTVNNLGYTDEEAVKYPWVAELSGGVDNRPIHEKRKASANPAE